MHDDPLAPSAPVLCEQVSVRLTADEMAGLRQLAAEEDRSLAYLIRTALRRLLGPNRACSRQA